MRKRGLSIVMLAAYLFCFSAASYASSVTGNVTRAAGGAAIMNIDVQVYDSNWNLQGSALTDAIGDYTVSGLAAGSYKVLFEPVGQYYVREWYNDKSCFEIAGSVTVIDGETTSNINAQLADGGSISGTVTKVTGGAAISGIYVQIYDSDGSYKWSDTTDVNGDYQVTGLPAGFYKVEFSNNGLNYVTEWYNDNNNVYFLVNLAMSHSQGDKEVTPSKT